MADGGASVGPYVRPPDPLDVSGGNPAYAWNRWKGRFDIYLKAAGASTKPEIVQVGLLLNHIGDKCIDIYMNFKFGIGQDKDSLAIVLAKFDEYFCKRDPQLMLRERFWNQLKRDPGQTFDSWVMTIRDRAAECKFPDEFRDEAIRDKLVFSCRDDSTKLKLYDAGAALTVEKAIQIISLKEATKIELQESKSSSIEAVSASHESKESKPWKRSTNNGSRKTCDWCCRVHRFGKEFCQAAKAKCHKCNQVGHFASSKKCTARVKRVQRVESEQPEQSQSSDTFFTGSVSSEDNKDPGWYARVRTASLPMNWVVDTGAQVSVIPKSVYMENQRYFDRLGHLREPTRKLVGAGNKTLDCVGCVSVEMQIEDKTIIEQVYVVDGATKLLLGLPGIRKFGLMPKVPDIYTITAIDIGRDPWEPRTFLRTVDDLKQYRPELAEPLGKWKGKTVHITKSDGAVPSHCATARRIAIPLIPKAKAEIMRMQMLDVIEPVDEPTDWCSPIVVVPKTNGDVRICVDLTHVNKAVKRETYQMPSVETTINKIAAGSVYSKLDCNSGYFQLELDEESRNMTTFITPFGRFRFKRLPYGISSGPEIFQKYMDEALSDIPGVVVQMDDILVEGKDMAEHDERLRRVLDRLAELGLTLNMDKCIIAQTKLDYLGQMIDGGTIRKDPSKVEAVSNMSEPTNTTELRRFLGIVNQLMKFCPNLSDITKPLRDLLKKDSAWQWGPEQARAFEDLKCELVSDRVLSMYDPNRETVVSADASSYGAGAVITQKQDDGTYRPIAYASRSMTETECRYAQIEKEALAITWAMEHWSELLVGLHNLKVETDHKPLVPLLSTKYIHELPIRIQRFRMRLMRYDFTISHVPGKHFYTADALSRAPDDSSSPSELHEQVEMYVNTVMVTLPVVDSKLDEIRQETVRDDELKVVMHYVQNSWPVRRPKGPLGKYWNERGNLSLHGGLLMRGSRVVIPQKMQPQVL